jgi:LPS-assembly lipoprotein
MPYKTMYIALPETADVRIWMQRYISAGGSTRIVDSAAEAEAVFQQLQDSRGQTILSVNAQGRARELRLTLTYRFRIVDAKGRELVAPNEVSLSRDVTYDDSNVLAKDLEQSLLWRDMNNDLVNQIVRRLTIIKPKNPDLEADD